ncbi:MAG TPA: GNAT family N-acetyltransferase [Coleofasciculaceae cyanobacterium]|jgi:putative acetyltransferase
MQIRLFQPEDTEQIAWLFHNTVRKINIQHYCLEQVTAWSPDDIYFRNWLTVCSDRFSYVAEQDGKIVGFGELEANGHIDCFYIHYQHQRQGIGSSIYQAIEIKARELNLLCLFTEVSITAKPFFMSRGFTVIKQQQVLCRGQTFSNYLMEKLLTIEQH